MRTLGDREGDREIGRESEREIEFLAKIAKIRGGSHSLPLYRR